MLIKRKQKIFEISLCMSSQSSPFPDREALRLLLLNGRGAEPMSQPIIYIASVYSGNIEANVEKTKEYSRHVIRSGGVPFNPVLNLHGVLDEESDRDAAIKLDLSLMKRCDELWAFGEPTAGMKIEITKAERIGMPIKYLKEALDEKSQYHDGE